MTQTQRGNLVLIIVAAGFISAIGGFPFNTMPVMLGSLADTFSLGSQQLGLVGSSALGGFVAGSVLASLWIERVNWKLAAVAGAAVTALGYLFTAKVSGEFLYAIWFVVGFGASTLYSLSIRVLSELPDKERAFGMRSAIELTITASVLFALPPLIIANWQYTGAAVTLALVIVVLGIFAYWLPARGSSVVERQPFPHFKSAAPAWAGLAILFVFFAGVSGLWAFLERMGQGVGSTPTQLGFMFAALKLIGAGSAFVAGAVGGKLGLRFPHIAVAVMILVGLFLLYVADSFEVYAAGAWIWEAGFSIGFCYQCAAVTRLDTSRRLVVFIPAALALGGTVGPGVAGFLRASAGDLPILVFTGIAAIVPAIAFLVLSSRMEYTQEDRSPQ